MKKLLIGIILCISMLNITGCENNNQEEIKANHHFITVEPNVDGKIIIDTKDITSTATFVNYEIDEVIIQFIVVRGTDNKVRIAFNTCQACNPSPNAYFIQVGEYLECQNCKNKFHIDEMGKEEGGCNPAPVEEKEEKEEQIIMDKDYVDRYKTNFENWNGPIK